MLVYSPYGAPGFQTGGSAASSTSFEQQAPSFTRSRFSAELDTSPRSVETLSRTTGSIDDFAALHILRIKSLGGKGKFESVFIELCEDRPVNYRLRFQNIGALPNVVDQ